MNAQTAWGDYASLYQQARKSMKHDWSAHEYVKTKRDELLTTELHADTDCLAYQAQLDAAIAEFGPDDAYDISNDLAKIVGQIERIASAPDALTSAELTEYAKQLWTICQRLNRLDMPENEQENA